MVDAAGKEQIATLFAAYIWDGSYWTSDIEIYDLQSAKRLATFGKMGFRVD